ncbi:M24 family metallopeptidase [Lysobacter sp. TAB13]|uniref:M24 family metallopeptidase n=1 Tax=Lysobacter sp. TAB13 TaxID=3233065 RepID=UPI003F9DED84
MTTKENVGPAFDPAAMLHARTMTWQAIDRIAAQIRPGMRESDAKTIGEAVLKDLGMARIWHPLLIRFGANTLKTFRQRSDGDVVLGEDDIYFIDMGVVWDGHEGDSGATFVTGADTDMRACADAAKTLFDRVHGYWKDQRVSGPELYRYAAEQAEAMGWVLNLDIQGHRVSDFPHAIYKAGDLGEFESCPAAGLWILEIQIAHPQRAFGAFYEDLLI